MKIAIKLISIIMAILMVFSLASCNTADDDYGEDKNETAKTTPISIGNPTIMSSDRVMPKYIDISLFDEENYSKHYLGKKFKFNVTVNDTDFNVPTTISALEKIGWSLVENQNLDGDSIIYAGDWIEAELHNSNGFKITALFHNLSHSSKRLKNCNIVKISINNGFYSSPDNYIQFNVNGINNKMAITEIIDTLGIPSHFYRTSESSYYLDYFITEKDRRNGITVYINPIDDTITAIEFSYYK